MWHTQDQSKEGCDEIERHLKHNYSPVVQKKPAITHLRFKEMLHPMQVKC